MREKKQTESKYLWHSVVQEHRKGPIIFSEAWLGEGRPPHAKSWLNGKDSDAGRDWGQEEKGTTEDEMAGWHHRLDGRESEWTQGVGEGQGGLVCCDSWCLKESDTTEWLIWSDLNMILVLTIWWCPFVVFSFVVGRWCLLWPVHSLDKTLLAFALIHSVFQS